MALACASAHLNDEEFLTRFHDCRLAPGEFRNFDHFRLTWLHLRLSPPEVALERISSGIRAFAEHCGAWEKYHATITAAWVRLVATHKESSFEEFLVRNAPKLNAEFLHRFWSPALLASADARSRWVAPDLRALPE